MRLRKSLFLLRVDIIFKPNRVSDRCDVLQVVLFIAFKNHQDRIPNLNRQVLELAQFREGEIVDFCVGCGTLVEPKMPDRTIINEEVLKTFVKAFTGDTVNLGVF